MIIIFYFSSIPTDSVPGSSLQRFLILKSFHLIEYFILFILLYVSFRKIKFSAIIAYLYALSDEIHQYFIPGRTAKISDTFIDLVGIIAGIIILRYFFKKITYTKL